MARRTGSHSEITGPRVRAAALKLFARRGFAAVSMRQIAADVGVQAGALYLYTPDKQTLLFELMREHLESLLSAWAAVDGGGDPLHRLARFVRFHIGFHIARRDAVFIANMELRNLNAENFARIEALRHRYEDSLEEILRAGVEAGLFDIEDTRLTTMAQIAMLTGVTSWYREDGRLDRTRVAEIYASMVEKAVCRRPAGKETPHARDGQASPAC